MAKDSEYWYTYKIDHGVGHVAAFFSLEILVRLDGGAALRALGKK